MEPTDERVEIVEVVPRDKVHVVRHVDTGQFFGPVVRSLLNETEARMQEPTDEQLAAIAEALYRLDAPRYGNDIRPFGEMAAWEQRKFVELARVAVTQWERVRSP